MALIEHPVPLLPERLDTSRDPKVTPLGHLVEAQNCYRVKSGEYRRRTGRTALATAGFPAGTLPDIWQLCGYKSDLFALSRLGSVGMIWGYDPTAAKWMQPAAANAVPSAAGSTALRTQQRGAWLTTPHAVHAAEKTAGSFPAGQHSATGAPDIAIIAASEYALVTFVEDCTTSASFVELIYDMSTGEVILRNVISGSNPHVEGSGSGAVVMYLDGTNLKARYWTTGDIADNSPAVTSLAITQPSASLRRMDTALYGGSTVLVAVGEGSPALTGIHVADYNLATGAFGTDVSIAVVPLTIGWLKDSGAAGRYFLATASATAVEVRVLTTALAVTNTHSMSTVADPSTTNSWLNNRGDITYTDPAASGTYANGPRNITGFSTGSAAAGNFVVIWDVPDGLAASGTAGTSPHNTKTRYNTVTGASVVGTVADWIRGVSLRSKVFKEAGGAEHYCIVSYGSAQQPSYFLMRVPTDHLTASPKCRAPVAKILMGRGNGDTELRSGLSNVVARTTAKWEVALTKQISVRAKANAGYTAPQRFVHTGIDVVEMETNPTNTGRPVEFADNLLVPAGQVLSFDGVQLAELGFPIFPEVQATPDAPATTSASGGGSMTASATYQYAIVYRHTDAVGRVHYSAVGIPATTIATTAANKTVTVRVPYLRLWGRDEIDATAKDNVKIEIYRTIGNGSTFFLLAEVENDPTLDSGSFVDTAADTALLSATAASGVLAAAIAALLKQRGTGGTTLLYTNGNVLANDAPPQFRAMALHRGRVFGISADDPQEIWFSKAAQPGRGTEFSAALVFRLDDDDGACTGIESFDDKLIVTKRNAVYAVMGDGPDALGQGQYPVGQRIARGLGAVSARGVKAFPGGCWIETAKGLYTVTRGLSVENAGKSVVDWFGSGVTVVDIVHVDADNHVRVYLSSGNCLVFDYYFNEWFLWTGQTTVCAALAGTVVYQVKPGVTATVTGDDATKWQDEGTGYTMRVAWPWISTAGINGFQRLWELQTLGDSQGAHTASIELSYDFIDTVSQTQTIVGLAFATGTVELPAFGSIAATGDTLTMLGSVSTVFEFRKSGTAAPPRVTVDLVGKTTTQQAVTALVAAINGAAIQLTAADAGDGVTVNITADAAGTTFNSNILSSNALILVSGMAGGGGPWRWRVRPTVQRCTSFKPSVSDGGPNSAGFRLTGLVALCGVEGPAEKRPVTATMA